MSNDPVMMVITCPSCAYRMKAPEALAGKHTSCLKCGERFQVGPPSDTTDDGGEAPVGSGIVRLLLEAKLVTEAQVREAEAVQAEHGVRIYEALIILGYLRKDEFDRMLLNQPGVASIDLKNYRIQDDLVALVPEEFAMERLVLPIDKLGKMLTLAMACPLDTDTIQEVQEMTDLRVNPVLSVLDDIQGAIKQCYGKREAEEEHDFSWMGHVGRGDATLAESSATTTVAPPSPEMSPEGEAFMARFEALNGLPPCPDVLKRIGAVADDPLYPIRDLALMCASDPVITARLTGTANAAAYGMPGRVDNVNLAVTLLGLTGALRVIETCGKVSPVDEKTFDIARFLERSRFCASAAQTLGRICPGVSASAAQTAGLLHKLGMLAMAQMSSEAAAFENLEWDADRMAREREILGISHPEAGAFVARSWRLPTAVIKAIRSHADPALAAQTSPLAMVTAIAARMAETHACQGGKSALDACMPLLDALHLDASVASRVFEDVTHIFTA